MNFKLLKLARHFSGHSQEGISDQLGIHRTVYNRYENGMRNIPIKHVKKIEEILGENGINEEVLDFLQGVISSTK